MFVGQRLLGISRDFWRAEDDECEYNGKSGYNDEKGDFVFYEPAYFVCALFKVANGTTFINLPRHFLNQNPPDDIYFCIDEKKHNLYLSFIEPRPEVPAFRRTLQKAGKNDCQIRLPFPRELKGIFFPDKYLRMTLTEKEKDLFLCKFEWEKPNLADYVKCPKVYDGD